MKTRLLFSGVVMLGLGLLAACSLTPQTPEPLPTLTPLPSQTASPTVVWFPPTDTPTPIPTQEVMPTPDQRPGLGQVLATDTFTAPSGWQTRSTTLGSIAYGKEELTLAIPGPKTSLISMREDLSYDNFYLELTASANLCRGADAYGLLVRASGPFNGYRLLASCDGQLRMERIRNGQAVPLQDWTPSGQVPPGAPGSVRLGIWAYNTEIRVFANDVYQFSVTDPVWRGGTLGVYARTAADSPVSVNFTQLEVRSLTVQPTLPPPTPTPTERPKQKGS